MGSIGSFCTIANHESVKKKADFTLKGFDLSFEDDRKVLIKHDNGTLDQGKYKFKSDSLLVIKKQGGSLKFKIQELSDTALNLEVEDVTFYFPKELDSTAYFTSEKTKLKFKRI